MPVREGAARRYPAGVPGKVRDAIAKKLALIVELGFARYRLSVRDMVCFAQQKIFLTQGCGLAAHSAVRDCPDVTAAITATVIHDCPKMAMREVGKAMGLPVDATSALSAQSWATGGALLR